MRTFIAGLIGLFMFTSTPAAFALDGNALAQLLVRKGIISEADLESLESELAKEQEAQDAHIKQVLGEASGVPGWVQRTTWKGDIRLRNEFRDRTGTGGDGNRQRVRFRYGFVSDVSDALQVGARFATGSLTDPVSTNQTLDDTFDKKNFNLDRAYLKYTSEELPIDKVTVVGGFFANPFVGSSLIWDGDLSFAGVATSLQQSFGPVDGFINTGIFPIDSDGFPFEWVGLYGIQGGVSAKPFEDNSDEVLGNLRLTSVIGYFDYKNALKTKTAPIQTQGGNTAAAEDFNEINFYNEVSTKVAGLPVKGWFDFVHNTSASSQDNGFQLGFKVGKAKKSWDLKEGWEAGYFFQRLESNAAFDGFVDSDFGGGGTNHRGNVWYVKLATLKNSTLSAKFFDTEELKMPKNHFDTFQLDWVTKF